MDLHAKLVGTALGELGVSAPAGDDKYISWYDQATGEKLPKTVSWCAIFVSWCARKAGVCEKAVPNYASCTQAVNNFKKLGTWRARGSYPPQPGDLVFFDWNRDPGVSEHTGIVTGTDASYVHTVEGNSGSPGAVRRKSYLLDSAMVLGYAVWQEAACAEGPPQAVPAPPAAAVKPADPIKTLQAELNARYGAKLAADGAWGPASRAAAVKAVQTELNALYKKGLAIDGSFGPASKAAAPVLKRGDANALVRLVQLLLAAKGERLAADGSFGPATEAAVLSFKKKNGLKADGLAGGAVLGALLG